MKQKQSDDHQQELMLPDDPVDLKEMVRTLIKENTRQKELADTTLAVLRDLLTSNRWRIGNLAGIINDHYKDHGILKTLTNIPDFLKCFRTFDERLKSPTVQKIESSMVNNLSSISQNPLTPFSLNLVLPKGYKPPLFEDTVDKKEGFSLRAANELKTFLASEEILSFATEAPPEVSVILVLYNHSELTLACLRSLLLFNFVPVEVIIVDNNSTDETESLLRRIEGAKIIRNKENAGFLAACNQAAKVAQGKYLLFLNNDALLVSDAIKNSLQVFKEEPETGAVGAKIILLDGKLQEAGSMVFKDGSTHGYGRGHDRNEPCYNFRRTVDYCSGAFLLTPTELFRETGCFDNAFLPAYYEEVDYCFRLREKGLNVVYDPSSVILHYEFGSSNDKRASELSQKNKAVFIKKHGTMIESRMKRSDPCHLKARFSIQNRRILVIEGKERRPQILKDLLTNLAPHSIDVTVMILSLNDDTTSVQNHSVSPRQCPIRHQPCPMMENRFPPRVEVYSYSSMDDISSFLRERKDYFDFITGTSPSTSRLFDVHTRNSSDSEENVQWVSSDNGKISETLLQMLSKKREHN